MIPAQAVEAAAKALGIGPHGITRTQLEIALKAAAPHIRADALDDAAKKLRSDMDVPQRIWVANKVRALAMIARGDA